MKSLLLLGFAFVLSQVAFAQEKYAFDCDCSSSKKACESLENFNILVESSTAANGGFWNEDGEFNSGYEAKASKLAAPKKYGEDVIRFDIENRSYNPDMYNNASLIVPNKKMKKAEIFLLDKKSNRLRLKFDCESEDPEMI